MEKSLDAAWTSHMDDNEQFAPYRRAGGVQYVTFAQSNRALEADSWQIFHRSQDRFFDFRVDSDCQKCFKEVKRSDSFVKSEILA